jgi:hypothetical protein
VHGSPASRRLPARGTQHREGGRLVAHLLHGSGRRLGLRLRRALRRPAAPWRIGKKVFFRVAGYPCTRGYPSGTGTGRDSCPRADWRAGKSLRRGHTSGRVNVVPALTRPAAIPRHTAHERSRQSSPCGFSRHCRPRQADLLSPPGLAGSPANPASEIKAPAGAHEAILCRRALQECR